MAIIFNGYHTMWCYVRDRQIVLHYARKGDRVTEGLSKKEYKRIWDGKAFNRFHKRKLGRHMMTFDAKKVMIGKCNCDDGNCPTAMHTGNAVLCLMPDGSYNAICCWTVSNFRTIDGKPIKKFISRIGNNGVPYAVAISETYTYFFMEEVAILNEDIPHHEHDYVHYWYYNEEEQREAAKPIPYNPTTLVCAEGDDEWQCSSVDHNSE